MAGADQFGTAAVEPFAALGDVTHHQDRQAERRRFLLDAAGIGQRQGRLLEQRDERHIIERRKQVHAGHRRQRGAHRRGDPRMGMDRQGDLGIGGKVAQCRQDARQPLVVLASVDGGDDQRAAPVDGAEPNRHRPGKGRVAGQPAGDMGQGIDAGVAGLSDRGGGDTLPPQRRDRCRRRGEMQVGELGDRLPVHFFGKGVAVAGAQAGLDMDQRAARIDGGLGAGEGAGGIALDDDGGRSQPFAAFDEARQQRGDDPGRRLPGLHDVEIAVGGEAEAGQRLMEQFAMLPGGDEIGPAPLCLQCLNDRSELDRFGARAGHEEENPFRRPAFAMNTG